MLPVLLSLLTVWSTVVGDLCLRRESKIVRNYINSDILPIYEEYNVEIPRDCLLSASRDRYGHQEANKYEESTTKWVCNICGKSFYEERFLDQHFDHKHPESLRKGDHIICLADYCDVFRCDVLTSHMDSSSSSHWDKLLCREKDLQHRQHKCMEIIHHCTPDELDSTTKGLLVAALNQSLCNYLSCEKYWEQPSHQPSPLSIVFYIVATMCLLLGLAIYFMVLRSQLAQNPPKLLRSVSESETDEQGPPLIVPQDQEIRHRHAPIVR